MDNKMLLLNCAKELFYAKGYDAVGVQEIVDRAGLTKPTLYYYFGSKLGLLKTLLAETFESLNEQIHSSVREDMGIHAALYELAKTYCSFFDKDRECYMLMMALFYSARENEAYQAVKPIVSDLYAIVVNTFERASVQLGNMNGRQRQFAIGFIGTVNHYLLMRCEADPDHKDTITEQQVVAVVNQFMYGIFS